MICKLVIYVCIRKLFNYHLVGVGHWVWLLPLLWCRVGMSGNGMCQKRGRESFQVAVRLGFGDESLSFAESKSLIILFLLPCPTLSRDTITCPRGKNLIDGVVERYFIVWEDLSGYRKGIVANGLRLGEGGDFHHKC